MKTGNLDPLRELLEAALSRESQRRGRHYQGDMLIVCCEECLQRLFKVEN